MPHPLPPPLRSSSSASFNSKTRLNSPSGKRKEEWERSEGVTEQIRRVSRTMEVSEMWSCQNTYFPLFFFFFSPLKVNAPGTQSRWKALRFELDPSIFRSQEMGSDEWRARQAGLKILHCLRWLFKHLPLSSPVFETWAAGWAHQLPTSW